MRGMKYKLFETKYQEFITYWGSYVLGGTVKAVNPANRFVDFLYGTTECTLTNQ